jgi:putative NADPH-quinone reductase
MPRTIAIVDGHPDPSADRFGHALAAAYAEGAGQGDHRVATIRVADLDFPLLRTQAEFDSGPVPAALRPCQELIRSVDHLLIVYPLWLGTMPALLKAFFEQTFRPDFAFDKAAPGRLWKKRLTGKSARIVVTMGMPALVYRWYFGAHGLKSLERNILAFSGIAPIRETLIGTIAALDAAKRQRWLDKMRALGRDGM